MTIIRIDELKLKDLKNENYLLLIDEYGIWYIKEIDKKIEKTLELQDFKETMNKFEGKLIIDKFPKRFFENYITKIKNRNREDKSRLYYRFDIFYLQEFLRFVETMEKLKYDCSIDYKKIKDMIVKRIIKLEQFLSEETMRYICFNAFFVELNIKIIFRKGKNIFHIKNTYQNIVDILKIIIKDDFDIRYHKKPIFYFKEFLR